MKILGDALKRAGTTDGPKLRDAIAQTVNFPGVTGTITINADRDAVKPAVVLKLEPTGRKFIYTETIQPEGAAATTTTGGAPAGSASPQTAGSPEGGATGASGTTASPAAGNANANTNTNANTNANAPGARATP